MRIGLCCLWLCRVAAVWGTAADAHASALQYEMGTAPAIVAHPVAFAAPTVAQPLAPKAGAEPVAERQVHGQATLLSQVTELLAAGPTVAQPLATKAGAEPVAERQVHGNRSNHRRHAHAHAHVRAAANTTSGGNQPVEETCADDATTASNTRIGGLAGVQPNSVTGLYVGCGALAGFLGVLLFLEITGGIRAYFNARQSQGEEPDGLNKLEAAEAPSTPPPPKPEAPAAETPLKQEAAGAPSAEPPSPESPPPAKEKMPPNPNRWHVLAVSCLAVVAADFYLGMTGPFFAGEAGKRGATTTECSFVIVSFCVGSFSTAILVAPKILESHRLNRINRWSLLLNGILGGLQGLAPLLPDDSPGPFIAYSTVLRLFEGAAAAMTEVCTQTMVMRSFDLDELPKAQGILQGTRSMVNLGTGPLGSALYTAGGYVLPYMIGPFVILGAYVALVWFSHYLDEVADPHKSKNLLQFLIDSRYPKLWGVVMFVLFLFIDVALYPSLLQVWLGAFPYCNPPNLVSAFLAATIGCFMIGLAIITTVSPIVRQCRL